MIKKLLLKLIGNDLYQPEEIEVKKMQDWLFKCHKDEGFKSYYTMRKKYLVNLMLLDLTEKERADARGRLNELRGLVNNINAEYKQRKLAIEKTE